MSQLIDNLNIIESVKTDIKSAIENKGVDMTGVSFPGYASKIGEISGGGGWDQKSITEGTNIIINLDNSASFVASSAFENKTIQTVNLPYATITLYNAFRNCTSLTQVNLPVCSLVGTNTFINCPNLSQVSLPMCSSISVGAFNYCLKLSQISLPVCSYIGNYVFQDCSSLSQVSIPVCSVIGYGAFSTCMSLSQISLPVCSYISGAAFGYCRSLSIITIGYSSVCSLGSSNAFNATQITSSTGSIYVPASLVSDYQSAENWSYFSTQIFPIE